MVKFGFDRQWIQWVMECVRTVSFATVINGEPGDFFLPQRGLRQGCPLSPYLFILCAEGFHYLIQKAVDRGDIKGIKIGKECPRVSHLFFADDSVVFGEATVENCNALNGILDKYEKASGQLVNRDKSSLFFSPNTPTHRKEEVTLALNIRHDNGGGKYLGIPSIIGRSKKGVFNYVRNNVITKMKGWKVNKLNQASREVLIKSVSMTMPNYVMQCFLLPKGFCRDLCKSISRFWWGSKEGEKKIQWVSWNKLCESKKLGGMGFRDLHSFNLAFLAKQGWRLVEGQHTLFHKVMKGKYFPSSSFWEAPCPNSASWAWRSIIAGREVLRKGWRWRVGDGKKINIWSDPWIPRSYSFNVLYQPSTVDSSPPPSAKGC